MAASVVNVNEVLDGHVALEAECVDRLYLNANLQVGGQVVIFLTQQGRHRRRGRARVKAGCPRPVPNARARCA